MTIPDKLRGNAQALEEFGATITQELPRLIKVDGFIRAARTDHEAADLIDELVEALENMAPEKPSLSGAFPGDPYLVSIKNHNDARALLAKIAKGENQ